MTEFYDIRLTRIPGGFVASCIDLPEEYLAGGRTEQEAWDTFTPTLEIWRDSRLIPHKEIPCLDMQQLDQVM